MSLEVALVLIVCLMGVILLITIYYNEQMKKRLDKLAGEEKATVKTAPVFPKLSAPDKVEPQQNESPAPKIVKF